MARYTLAQSPEVVLTVAGKDSLKAREKAMAELMELMDSGKLDTDLADGFYLSIQQQNNHHYQRSTHTFALYFCKMNDVSQILSKANGS